MDNRLGGSAGVRERTGEQENSHLMRVVGQLFMIPVAALVYSMELLVKALHGMQGAANHGLEAVVGGSHAPQTEVAPQTIESAASVAHAPDLSGTLANSGIPPKEDKALSNGNAIVGLDKDLHDDMLKLVRYKILFVKREYEYAFAEKEDLVSDNMDGNAFTAWKVAEFIQQLQSNGSEKTKVPKKWKEKDYPPEKYVDGDYLTGLPEEDKKYLRIYYEVLERYPREKFKYEEQQIRVLEEIRNKLPGRE